MNPAQLAKEGGLEPELTIVHIADDMKARREEEGLSCEKCFGVLSKFEMEELDRHIQSARR